MIPEITPIRLLVSAAFMQVAVILMHAAIAYKIGHLEQERRNEEGALIGWKPLPSEPGVPATDLQGRIYQMAVWNRGQRSELIWNTELRAIGISVNCQYPVQLSNQESQQPPDHTWKIPARSADRVQVRLPADALELARLEGAWLYLRYQTPDGPRAKNIAVGDHRQPPNAEVMRGIMAPQEARKICID